MTFSQREIIGQSRLLLIQPHGLVKLIKSKSDKRSTSQQLQLRSFLMITANVILKFKFTIYNYKS